MHKEPQRTPGFPSPGQELDLRLSKITRGLQKVSDHLFPTTRRDLSAWVRIIPSDRRPCMIHYLPVGASEARSYQAMFVKTLWGFSEYGPGWQLDLGASRDVVYIDWRLSGNNWKAFRLYPHLQTRKHIQRPGLLQPLISDRKSLYQ